MITNLRRSAVTVLVFTVFFGFVYAFVGTGIAQAFFRGQADGSLTANGSILIGQNWSQTKCPGHLQGSCVFQGRPDAVGPYAGSLSPAAGGGDNPLEANNIPGKPGILNPGESGATNLGPRSETLLQNTKKLIAYWRARGVNPTPDLVTTSGSGLDPDITPQDADAEIPMVSRATGIAPSRLHALVDQQTQSMQLGFLGSPFVNVLQLNDALATLKS
ncbi:MAG TPA: potassium-transporting ATPase subunit C [Acidimicrobiales bacterium]|nr:potassium-transporting ATPase subunit C [Acidimicrobiales bacterium]